MALNSSKKTVIKHRREAVAKLRLRGLTQREIVDKLTREGLVNPETGQSYSIGTINADVQTLETEWRKQASADTAALKGRTLAELHEVKRAAWEENQLTTVLRAIDQEVHLMGLDVRNLRIAAPPPEMASSVGQHPHPLDEQLRMAMNHASDEERSALSEKLESLLADVTILVAKPQITPDNTSA